MHKVIIALTSALTLATLHPHAAAATEMGSSLLAHGSADKLAGVIIGDYDTSGNAERLLAAISKEFEGNPDFVALEGMFPGSIEAFKTAMRPLLQDETVRILPKYQRDLAALYAANLSEEEARQLLDFMGSPAMSHFRKLAQENFQLNNSARDLLGKDGVGTTALTKDLTVTGIRAGLKLPPEEIAEIATFYQAPLGKKFAALNPQKIAIDQKWANYVSPEGERAIKKAIPEAMVAHVAKTDPKAAERIKAAFLQAATGNPM